MELLPINGNYNYSMKLVELFAVFMCLSSMAMHTSLESGGGGGDGAMTPPLPSLSSLSSLRLDGRLSFHNLSHASSDFGNRFHLTPAAVIYPETASDVAATVAHLYQMAASSSAATAITTVAPRGGGHSLQGQAQAAGGVVVNMESLRRLQMPEVVAGDGEEDVIYYVDVSGGDLWIDVLKSSLEHGLSPKSWTDYLHLTVGGTLSNAGISGQAFRHGPQISNVHHLQVVTGKGELVSCSPKENSDLFYSVLGGLGQFGIITRARIALELAPKMVKWIRVLYSDFTTFTHDQEMLISTDAHELSFDYVEGFVLINRTGLVNNWRSSFKPQDPVQANLFSSDNRTLYCLEMAKYVFEHDTEATGQEVKEILSRMKYIRSTLFETEVSYLEFLDRVHVSEAKLRSRGLWDIPHPWLNLLVPRKKIHIFARGVFGKILKHSNNGPILLYPLHKSRWDNRTSAVIPDDDDNVFYLVAFLTSAPPSPGHDTLEEALQLNTKILEFCEKAQVNMKQYLPHYITEEEWKAHYGPAWPRLVRRKYEYDPFSLLSPGQRIFTSPIMPSSRQTTLATTRTKDLEEFFL